MVMESIHAAAEERKQVISCAFSCCEGGDVSSSWPMVSSGLIANWGKCSGDESLILL